MGISLSKQNSLIQDGFDGNDYDVSAETYHTAFGPEWIFGNNELIEIKKQLIELNNIPEKIPLFSLENHIVAAKCVKVWDGDTVHLVIPYHDEIVKYRFRMIGYNSPELYAPTQEEKDKAIAARNYLANKLLHKKVIARLGKFDKYGRPLCDLYLIDNEEEVTLHNAFKHHINKEMIEKGYGKPYLG